jgi:hypothetical protein
MKTSDFTTSFVVDNSPKEIFESICNVADWWQGEIKGGSKKLDDQFIYRMEDLHFSIQKVHEIIPNKKLVWLITESKLTFAKNKSEWTGTKVIFDIIEEGGKTKVIFTHKGLIPDLECYNECSNAWTQLVQKGLKGLITTGKAQKAF